MNQFWGSEINGQPFHMFSPSHLVTLAIFSAVTILLVIWFYKRKASKAVDRFRYILAALIAVGEISILVWSILVDYFDLDITLPLQLCDLAAILSIIVLIGKYKAPFEVVYFWGLGGSLQAMITPALSFPFPHIIFFNFFLVHGAIVISIFYLIAAKGFRPTWRSILKTFVITNLYSGIVAVINFTLGSNYLFLSRKPDMTSIIDYLGPWPWYILSLEGVLLVICLLLYIPFAIQDCICKRSKSEPPAD